MVVTIQPLPAPTPPVRAVPRHHLIGPNERAYEFADLGSTVRVRRFESHQPVRVEELPIDKARSRWSFLRRIGYTPAVAPF